MKKEQLEKDFRYDGETGALYRIFKNGVERPAGFVRADGFLIVNYQRRKLYAHKIAYTLTHGVESPRVMHANGDRSDNRIVNLIGDKKQEQKTKEKKAKRECKGKIDWHLNSSAWIKRAEIKNENKTWILFKAKKRKKENGWSCFKLIRKESDIGRSTYWLYYHAEREIWMLTKDKRELQRKMPEVYREMLRFIC